LGLISELYRAAATLQLWDSIDNEKYLENEYMISKQERQEIYVTFERHESGIAYLSHKHPDDAKASSHGRTPFIPFSPSSRLVNSETFKAVTGLRTTDLSKIASM
jgi:hypothetical protein